MTTTKESLLALGVPEGMVVECGHEPGSYLSWTCVDLGVRPCPGFDLASTIANLARGLAEAERERDTLLAEEPAEAFNSEIRSRYARERNEELATLTEQLKQAEAERDKLKSAYDALGDNWETKYRDTFPELERYREALEWGAYDIEGTASMLDAKERELKSKHPVCSIAAATTAITLRAYATKFRTALSEGEGE
jgi:predicted nuclease with TOPRIM domain